MLLGLKSAQLSMSDQHAETPQGVRVQEEMEQLPSKQAAAPCQLDKKQSSSTIDSKHLSYCGDITSRTSFSLCLCISCLPVLGYFPSISGIILTGLCEKVTWAEKFQKALGKTGTIVWQHTLERSEREVRAGRNVFYYHQQWH